MSFWHTLVVLTFENLLTLSIIKESRPILCPPLPICRIINECNESRLLLFRNGLINKLLRGKCVLCPLVLSFLGALSGENHWMLAYTFTTSCINKYNCFHKYSVQCFQADHGFRRIPQPQCATAFLMFIPSTKVRNLASYIEYQFCCLVILSMHIQQFSHVKQLYQLEHSACTLTLCP